MSGSKPTIITFPPSRIGTLDINVIANDHPHIKALLEVDVTEARIAIKEQKESGKEISFTGWLIFHLCQSLRQYPRIHAFLRTKRSLAIFEDIDVSLMVEREHRGDKVPLVYVLREANKKSEEQMSAEIRKAQSQPLEKNTTVLGNGGYSSFLTRLYFSLPGFLRRLVWRLWLGKPERAKKMMGSVMVTSVGMFGQVHGWFLNYSVHPLSLGVGSIMKKPAVIDDQITIREFLYLTILMDHNVVDGAYMARFVADLCGRLQGTNL